MSDELRNRRFATVMKNKFLFCLVILMVAMPALGLVEKASDQVKVDSIAFADKPEVQDFIRQMVEKYHFSQEELVQLFDQLPIAHPVLKTNKLSKEITWQEYRDGFLSSGERVQNGVVFWKKHEEVLKRAEQTYGVPPHVIVAIIGIESDYGQYVGHNKEFEALANLAFSDSPRRNFFRDELTDFLLMCREYRLNPWSVLGSFDGGIGQPQFMPSSFLHYAVDFDHSGKVDLTHDDGDVIGSIAFYLKENGWHRNELLAIPARRMIDRGALDAGTNTLKASYTSSQLLSEHIWPRIPILQNEKVGLVSLTEEKSQNYWVALPNLYVVTQYNHGLYYGMLVYELSENIKEAFEKSQNHSQNLKHSSITV